MPHAPATRIFTLFFCCLRNSSDKESQPACDHCARDFKQHGTVSTHNTMCTHSINYRILPLLSTHLQPSFCVICNLQSAFNGKRCTRYVRVHHCLHSTHPRVRSCRCTHSEKKYGTPVACESCNLACAFRKPDDIRKKVILNCTL